MKTAKIARSETVLTAATMFFRLAEMHVVGSAWHGGTMAFPFSGAAMIFLQVSPSAQASSFLRSQGAQGSDPMIMMGTSEI